MDEITVTGWRKSARCGGSFSCVEAGTWRTSSASMSGGHCAEAGSCSHGVAVRDSKDTAGPVLTFSASAWVAFTGSLKAG